jgi:molybdopterin molybdotransferase
VPSRVECSHAAIDVRPSRPTPDSMPDQPVTPMISAAEAEQLIRGHGVEFAATVQSLDLAAGCILRQSIVAERDQPPFDRVTMDGIAVRYDDFSRGTRRFDVVGLQAAGMAPVSMDQADACIEVMTGAVMPAACKPTTSKRRVPREKSS